VKTETWAHWAEIIASFAVVVTLVFLVAELRTTSKALERQAAVDRAEVLARVFVENPPLAATLAKIKAVDGMNPFPEALVQRYGLEPAEAISFARHVWEVWIGMAADYRLDGGTEELRGQILDLLSAPDQQLFWPIARESGYFGVEFVRYVDRVRETG
jgi:hypothetical protein